MRTATKRLSVILIIIALSIVLGAAVSVVWSLAEKFSHPYEYGEYIEKYSEEFDVPASLIYAVIKVESDFDKDAVSRVGARGLMQMMEPTFGDVNRYLGEEGRTNYDDIFEPDVSIRYGTYYLRYLYDMFGNWETVTAAYNGGLGNVRKWLKDPAYSDDGVTLKDIPFEETKNYVSKVNREIDTYKKLYEGEENK